MHRADQNQIYDTFNLRNGNVTSYFWNPVIFFSSDNIQLNYRGLFVSRFEEVGLYFTQVFVSGILATSFTYDTGSKSNE